MKKFLIPATLAIALIGAGPAFAATTTTTQTHTQSKMAPSHMMAPHQGMAHTQTVAYAAVRVNNQEVARLASAGGYSPQARAAIFRRAVETGLVRNGRAQAFRSSDVTVKTVGANAELRLNGRLVALATPADAKLSNTTPYSLAQNWASSLRSALMSANIGKTAALPKNLVTVAMGKTTIREAAAGGGAGAHTMHTNQMRQHQTTGQGQMQHNKGGMGSRETQQQTQGKSGNP
ncbi:MAG TPA: hypothetical protein V6D47_11595 [Oscillatoriaceae cyanobacterium]